MDALPLSPQGKVLKHELRKPHWEGMDRQVNGQDRVAHLCTDREALCAGAQQHRALRGYRHRRTTAIHEGSGV